MCLPPKSTIAFSTLWAEAYVITIDSLIAIVASLISTMTPLLYSSGCLVTDTEYFSGSVIIDVADYRANLGANQVHADDVAG